MIQRILQGIALVALCAAGAANGETAWVTDQLRLGIHEAPDTSDSAFATLLSGEQVEILEQNIYYARVKMQDERIGWVRKTYLVTEPPAVRRVDDLEAERNKLAETSKRLQDEVIETRTRLNELEAEVSSGAVGQRAESEQLRELRKETNALSQKLSAYSRSVPLSWAIGTGVATLVVGIWFGWWWTDYRARKRHGGFRI